MDVCPSFRFRPPTHPSYDGRPPPESVVLDTRPYIDDRTNATTASGTTAGGHAIKVTFWIAHPPRVSHFTIHFPNLPDLTALAELPHILHTDDDLVLLRVALGPSPSIRYPVLNDYIIYRAGSDKLQVLPPHPDRLFSDHQVGLLRCRGATATDDDNFRFIVASLRHTNTRDSNYGDYLLEMFDSRTWTWSTKSKYADPMTCTFTLTSKVITIGGEHGSIGWVDLSNGILIADVLRHDDDDDGILGYIMLPELMVPNKLQRGPMSAYHDIIVSKAGGNIKYLELCVHTVRGSLPGDDYIVHDWQAAAWTWNDSDKEWVVDDRLKASEIMVDERCSGLLPTLLHCDEEEAKMMKPTLSRLHVGHPALSLHEDADVYIMAKVDYWDHKAWMMAVDTRNKTLKQVVDFDAQRTAGFRPTYIQSRVSNHLRVEVEEEGDSLMEDDAPWIEVSCKKKKSGKSRDVAAQARMQAVKPAYFK